MKLIHSFSPMMRSSFFGLESVKRLRPFCGITSKITRSRREIFHCQNARLRDSGAFFCYPTICDSPTNLWPSIGSRVPFCTEYEYKAIEQAIATLRLPTGPVWGMTTVASQAASNDSGTPVDSLPQMSAISGGKLYSDSDVADAEISSATQERPDSSHQSSSASSSRR